MALRVLLARAFGPAAPLTFSRTWGGVSTLVYCVERGSEVFYLRLAEEEDEDLSVDAWLLSELGRRGVRVPEAVFVDSFDSALGRSVMITTRVEGVPLAQARSRPVAEAVVREAGRDLALLNQVPVQGFGWVRRDRAAGPLAGELSAYSGFVTSYLPDPWPGPMPGLFSATELQQVEGLIASEQRRQLRRGHLAHGDFDVTHIFENQGRYSGVIDFGEIRGAEPGFDLGHFLLHDGETLPRRLFDSLLAGYAEVVPLEANYQDQVRRSAILLGLRQLCRWISAERGAGLDDPVVANRARRLKELLGA